MRGRDLDELLKPYARKYYRMGYEMAKNHHWMGITPKDVRDIILDEICNGNWRCVMRKIESEEIEDDLFEWVSEWVDTEQWRVDVLRNMRLDLKKIGIEEDDEDYWSVLSDLIGEWEVGYFDYMIELYTELKPDLKAEVELKVKNRNME